MNMKPRKEHIFIFKELPYLYKNKMIPPNQSSIFKKNIYTQYVQFCAQL